MQGAIYSLFLGAERKKLLAYNGFYGHTYFWRSKAQAEVDYIEEIDGKVYAYEFKWNPGAKSKFPPSFLEAYKPVKTDIVEFRFAAFFLQKTLLVNYFMNL